MDTIGIVTITATVTATLTAFITYNNLRRLRNKERHNRSTSDRCEYLAEGMTAATCMIALASLEDSGVNSNVTKSIKDAFITRALELNPGESLHIYREFIVKGENFDSISSKTHLALIHEVLSNHNLTEYGTHIVLCALLRYGSENDAKRLKDHIFQEAETLSPQGVDADNACVKGLYAVMVTSPLLYVPGSEKMEAARILVTQALSVLTHNQRKDVFDCFPKNFIGEIRKETEPNLLETSSEEKEKDSSDSGESTERAS